MILPKVIHLHYNGLPLYQDGTVAKWIGQVQEVFVEIGSIPDVVPPETFFDPNLYIEIAK